MKHFLIILIFSVTAGLISGCAGSGGSSGGVSATGSCSVDSDCTPSNLSAVPASS